MTTKPPIDVNHVVAFKADEAKAAFTVVALYGSAAWVVPRQSAGRDWPETVARDDLVSLVPPANLIERTPEEVATATEQAKLQAVRGIVKVIGQNDPKALKEMLTRLTKAYKGRILHSADDPTDEQMAQGLLATVLMAAITVGTPT